MLITFSLLRSSRHDAELLRLLQYTMCEDICVSHSKANKYLNTNKKFKVGASLQNVKSTYLYRAIYIT